MATGVRGGLIAALALVAACSAEVRVFELADETELAIVSAGGARRVWLRGEAPIVLEEDIGAVTVLGYGLGLEALALSRGADGTLDEAPIGASEEEAWPLPVPASARRLEGGAIRELDAAERASVAGSIHVPVPHCGAFEPLGSTRIEAGSGNVHVTALAVMGASAMFSAWQGAAQEGRAYFSDGAELRPLPLDGARGQPMVFADEGAFLVLVAEAERIRRFRVALDGRTVTPLADLPSRDPPYFVRAERWPGGRAVFTHDGERRVSRLDLDTGAWSNVSRGQGSPHVDCDVQNVENALVLTGEREGVASFPGFPFVGFSDTSSDTPVVDDRAWPGRICQAGYARFGVELAVAVVNGTKPFELVGAFRSSAEDAWTVGPFPFQLFDAHVVGDCVVGIDGGPDALVLIGADARRPDQRPRACHRAFAQVRRVSMDGERGVALVHEDGGPMQAVSFRITGP